MAWYWIVLIILSFMFLAGIYDSMTRIENILKQIKNEMENRQTNG